MNNCLELIQQHEDLNCKVGRRWASVKGLEKYFLISDDGILRSLPRLVKRYSTFSKTLLIDVKASVQRHNYYCCITRKYIHLFIHIEVARAFVPNPFNYKYVHHIDGNQLNNNYTNLRWDKYRKQRNGKLSPVEVIAIRKDIKNGCSRKRLAELHKVSLGTIRDIVNNKIWKNLK